MTYKEFTKQYYITLDQAHNITIKVIDNYLNVLETSNYKFVEHSLTKYADYHLFGYTLSNNNFDVTIELQKIK